MNDPTRYGKVRRGLAFLLGWVCLGVHFAAAANLSVFHLRNGDRISGVLLSETNGMLTLSNSVIGKVQVSADRVERREKMAEPAAPENRHKQLLSLSQAYESGALTAKEYHQKRAALLAQNSNPIMAAGGAPPVGTAGPAPPPGPVAQPPPAEPKRWSGEALLGIDLLFSENQRQLYSGRFKLGYAHKLLRNLFDYQFAYGRTDGITSDNRMYATDKTDYEIGNNYYVYNLGGLGYDRIRKINFRFESGPGIGYHLVRTTNFILNTEFGVNYQAQYQSDDTQTETFYFRLAEDFAWKISPRLTLDEKFEFFPAVERFDTYRFRFEANLRYSLRNNLSLVLTVLDQFDTRPAEAVTQNDLQVRSSVGLKF